MDTKKIETVLTTVTIDSKVDSGKIDVVVGESAKMDVVKAVNYIQSGKAEIEKAVNQGKTVISDHTTEKIGEFDSNAVDKTQDFNDNASDKTQDFNDNYIDKKALIDAEVAVAEGYSAEAKQWAIGEPTEPSEGSAKYWAEQAAESSGLPVQTGNAGKYLKTDGSDASWEYSIKYRGSYDSSTQYYPGDVVRYYYAGQYLNYLCKQASVGNAPGDISSDYWCGFENDKFTLQKLYGDYPILPFMKQSSTGTTINTVSFIPGSTSTYNNFPTINTSTGLLKAPNGIDGYSPDSAFGATAFSNEYSDLDNLPNYGAGLSYSSSSLQLLDQNGNNLGSAVTIKSTPDLDGVTIDTNSDDELEAIGTINKNTAVGATAVKYDWIGTLAEYNSQNVETLHPEWVCYITDDVSGGTSVYTKAEVDSAISTALTTMLDSAFPVGSRYITENSTCPLAALIPNSTWVLTSQGRVIQGADSNHLAGTTAEAGLPNIEGTFGYLKEAITSNYDNPLNVKTGAFSRSYQLQASPAQKRVSISTTDAPDSGMVVFDASSSNSIYGNSTTVQPPAEFVNIFKRVL